MRELTGGSDVALVDDADYDVVSKLKWHVVYSGSRTVKYAYCSYLKMRMHTLILGSIGVDHVNHNGMDNRRENLRLATSVQQSQNRRRRVDNTSGYKGVSFNGDKWHRSIYVDGKNLHKRFDSELEAARDYDRLAYIHFGEFAVLNFPTEGGG